MKSYVSEHGLEGKSVIAVLSGANTNFDRLRYISERTDIGERREAILSVTIPETPGAFRAFCGAIGKRNITEFNYRFADVGDAHIFVGVELRDVDSDKAALIDGLVGRGYPVVDMSDNEMAKIHVRYMVGGRSGRAGKELLYRLNFPERPGALLRFLTHMGEHWNISLFHYRNHGADYGRVLIGVQVPKSETAAFDTFLANIGYEYVDETGNPAYELFLS